MKNGPWKVGELAKVTGLTVRTLHHYDEIGLLAPSEATASGHRLYTKQDVARLQQVLSMRALGFSLEQIKTALVGTGSWSPRQVVQAHLDQVRAQLDVQKRLLARMEDLTRFMDAHGGDVSPEAFIEVIGAIAMVEKYFTKDQLEELEKRKNQLGVERIQEVEGEWPRLMAEVQAHMEKGTDPKSPEVQALARQWMALVKEFTGGNPAIEGSLKTMYQQESKVAGKDVEPMQKMMAYITRANS